MEYCGICGIHHDEDCPEKAGYTKGEWGIYREAFGRECEVRAGSRLIAKVQFPGHNSSEDVANAHLIAKAPRMYEVIKYLATNGWNAGVSEEAKAIFNELGEGK